MPIFEAGVTVVIFFEAMDFWLPSCGMQAVAEALTRTFQKAKDWRKNVWHFNATIFTGYAFQGCKEDISSPSPYLYAFIVVSLRFWYTSLEFLKERVGLSLKNGRIYIHIKAMISMTCSVSSYLEDGLPGRTDMWLITMVIVSPIKDRVVEPLPNGL